MKILIDADACPVTRIAEAIARRHLIPVTLLCDTSHVLVSDYSTVKTVGAGADAVDLALINLCRPGDLVVTQDYGVAALALGRGALAIHQSGRWYTDANIDALLMERHLARKARQSGRHSLKGPPRRTEEDDLRFAANFERLVLRGLGYVCRIAGREEMERRWDDEIARHAEDRALWLTWKREALRSAEDGSSLPYYGFLGEESICEATAVLSPAAVQNSAGLVGPDTAYLCAFRTVPAHRGRGFFSALLRFLLEDLRKRGYTAVTLGVEPREERNAQIYRHWGFTEYVKSARETYPDGTVIDVEYYRKALGGTGWGGAL